MIQTVVKNSDHRLISTEDGIHLDNSVLWLDSKSTGQLSFISSAGSVAGKLESRILCTPDTLRILQAQRQEPKALVSEYNHSVALGQLRMELLPSGAGLGSASLYVETPHRTLLYAPAIQTQKTDICRQMQLQKAETLILGAKLPLPAADSPSRKKQKQKLLAAIDEQIGSLRPVFIICEPTMVAQELTKLCTQHGLKVAVHRQIHKIHKLYEAQGIELGDYTLFQRLSKSDRPQVVFLPKSIDKKFAFRKPLPNGCLFSVDESATLPSGNSFYRSIRSRFVIPSLCDPRELKEVIQKVEAKRVWFFGPYAKDYVKLLKDSAYEVNLLFPAHLPALF